MRRIMLKLWKDDCGALIAVEWLFIGTILVIGLVAGLTTLRNHVVNELEEFGNAVSGLNQCYKIEGLAGCGGGSCSSSVEDTAHNEMTNIVKSCQEGVNINAHVCD
jgi:Flp pilus assembly pilin Flp